MPIKSINGEPIEVGTKPSGNLFNKDTTTAGYLYYYSTGTYQSNSNGYGASEFIPCNGGSKYALNRIAHVCFWDSERNYISGLIQPQGSNNYSLITAPDDARYITISIKESEKDGCLLVESDTALNGFRAYGETLKNEYDDAYRLDKALRLLGDGYMPIDIEMVGAMIGNDGSVSFPTSRIGPEACIADYFASDYFSTPDDCSCIVRSADPTLIKVWWWAFSADKSGMAHGSGWKGSDTIPAGYPYYRVYAAVQGSNRYIPNLANNMVEVGYSLSETQSEHMPYQSGYIYHQFEVPSTKALTSEKKTNTAYLRLPASYTQSGDPTKLCLLVHGASMGISSDGSTGWTYNTPYNNIVNALINAGYAVIDSNGYDDSVSASHDHWGCPQALAGYHKAWDYFTTKYNLEREVYVYGFSMGGLTSLNLATERTIPIKCMMIGSPVISLYNQCVSGIATSVNPTFLAAYGITAYTEDAVRGYDRYLDIVNVGSDGYVFNNLPPLFIGYGNSDVNISNEKIQEYYEALCNSNHMVSIKEYEGDHSISYGGNANLISDIIKWFGYF